jgi:hypothetical protein
VARWVGNFPGASSSARVYHRRVLRARHLVRLSGDILAYAVVNRAWWVIPVMLVLGLATLLVVVGQAAAPVTLYPMF